MDFNTLYEYTRQGVRTLGAGWLEKAAAASIGAMLQLHAELMGAFIVLIILDLATKWLPRQASHGRRYAGRRNLHDPRSTPAGAHLI